MKKIISILVIVLFAIPIFSQSRWVRSYLEDENPTRGNLVVSYDKGYLITGRVEPNYPRNIYMIKTDINGVVLWQKMLGDAYNVILPGGSAITSEGSIYFSGSYGVVGAYGDPLILKLNSCGEKEWCYIFPTDGYHDYGMDCCITPDNGVAFVMIMTGEYGVKDRVCLARFSSNGNFLWKQCYNLPDTVAMGNELAYFVISTPDSGFLISGDCYYSNPEDSLSYLSPYYIKTDYNGDLEWYTIAGFHPYDVPGEGRQTVLSPDSNYYYSGIMHDFWDTINYGKSAPAILKMDMQGNVVDVYDIATPNTLGTISSLKFLSDTTIAAAAVWGPWSGPGGPDMNKNAVIIDTLGNILEQTVFIESNWPALTEVTHDKKILYFVEDVDENSKSDVYLFKLNQQLQSDTVYNQWYNYDSLCPYQVTSDTIPIEGCGLIVGTEDQRIVTSNRNYFLKIFPNPTKDKFTIESNVTGTVGTIVEIYDLYGVRIKIYKLNVGQNRIEIDVSSWVNGLYLIRVLHKSGIVEKGRIIVQ